MIQERVRAGLRRAKAQGTKSGKPCGRPKVEAPTEEAIWKALAKGGIGVRKIAVTLGVGTGTVQRIKAELTA
jgi:DNA invertase Pin-like site-specific DNA recombinase